MTMINKINYPTVGKQLKHTSNPFNIVKLFMNGFVLTVCLYAVCV